MRRQGVLLGIDAGTSGVKVCAFTPDGTLLHKEKASISVNAPQLGYVELDVENYWTLVKEAVRKITENSSYSVLGIGLSTTCPTVITMDKDFNAIGYGITYLDNRAAGEAQDYLARFPSMQVYESTIGNRCSVSTCSVSSMKWIQDNEPDRWNSTAYIGMLNSFFAAKLTGTSAIDQTQASYSGIFRLSMPDTWDEELVSLAGIEREKLLDVVPPSTCIGMVRKTIAEELGIEEGVPVAIGSGDTAAAAFAIGFKNPHHAFESAGTSGVFTFVSDKPRFNTLFMNRCHVFPGLWIAHGANSMMGGALDWLRNNILPQYRDYQYLDAEVANAKPGANGVVFLPYLSGERSPIWNPRAKAVWYGLTMESTHLDMLESVFEAGAFSMRQIKEIGEAFFQVSIDAITAVGNCTNSAHWSQMKADVLQVTYAPTAFTDAAAYGAALMGGIAAGIFSGPLDNTIPFLEPEGRPFVPSTEDVFRSYSESFKRYISLYPALKDIMNTY
jgi:xylulokinase